MPIFRKSRPTDADTYLWCDTCRRSFAHEEVTGGFCPVCGGPTRAMGKYSAILRGLMSNELSASPLESKHRQMIRLMWSANGVGEQYYRIIEPDMPYNRFEARVTDLLCRGAVEGWVTFVFPPAPMPDESAYRIEFADEQRFLAELETAFAKEEQKSA